MMKAITGEMFRTSAGLMLIHNEQDKQFAVGERIVHNGREYAVKEIVPPTRPMAKWSLCVE